MRDARLWLVAEMDPVHRGHPGVPVTDSDGRARLEVKRGEPLFPYLELGGEEGMRNMALAAIDTAAVEEGCRDELDIELPASTVRVEVKDPASGASVPGAFVAVHAIDSQAPRGPRRGVRAVKGATGPTGVISIPGLAAGGWVLYASTNRGRKRVSRTIELQEGDAVEVQLVVVEEAE
jgi:hypothetical protein